ncbi:MAG: SPOR domain-containing protein [Bacteroidota bacterium]
MRRLDTFTIIIIAVCLVAAGLLIWIGYNKLAGDKQADNSDLYEEIQDDEDGDYYYLDDEDDTDLAEDQAGTPDDFSNSGSNIEEDEPQNTSTTSSNSANYEVVDKNDEEETLTPRSYSSEGRYMVIAGTFSFMANAEDHAKTVRGKGYDKASVEKFDGGAYAVVLVDRFSSLSDAQSLIRKLKGDGVDAYVKKQ